MLTVAVIATVLRAAWFVAETLHASRTRVAPVEDRDEASLKLLKAATLAVPVGVAVGFTDFGRVRGGAGDWLAALGLGLMVVGIGLRWAAIRTLGRFFTRAVSILEGHRIVRSGLYRHLRHPSYTGYLLGNLGLGLALANWASTLIIFVPVAAATLYRIRVEERALLERFGDEYVAHARSTKRLIPKVF